RGRASDAHRRPDHPAADQAPAAAALVEAPRGGADRQRGVGPGDGADLSVAVALASSPAVEAPSRRLEGAAGRRQYGRRDGGATYLKIVSSRRGPVETIAAGHSVSSSMNLM